MPNTSVRAAAEGMPDFMKQTHEALMLFSRLSIEQQRFVLTEADRLLAEQNAENAKVAP